MPSISLLCVVTFVLSSTGHVAGRIADADRMVPQLIESRGFFCHEEAVVTKDGYHLTIHRIVNPYVNGTGKPIILQHGLFMSSADWLINTEGPDARQHSTRQRVDQSSQRVGNNLGFELSLRGYDVWLANSRGNRYSRGHDRLSSSSKKFWDFSFDEKIEYDMPAVIDHVQKVTSSSTVGFVGHSQGTMIMFGLMATQPKYNDIIKPFIALAPVTTVGHISSPIRHLASKFLMPVAAHLGGPFTFTTLLTRNFARYCPALLKRICSNAIFLIAGYNIDQLDTGRLEVYLAHTPAGTSWKNVLHFAQGVRTKRFAKYDAGPKANIARYGRFDPPGYPLDKITSRHIALFSSNNDFLSDQKDVALLKSKLKEPLIDDYIVPHPHWNHIDFLWGKESGTYVNKRIIRILDNYA